MKNNKHKNAEEKFEKDMNQIWHQAANATMIMTLVSLGIFLIVFLILFFLTRNRLETEIVIPFSLFSSLIIMFITQALIRRLVLQKRKHRHA